MIIVLHDLSAVLQHCHAALLLGCGTARFGPLDTTLTPANLVDLAYLTSSQAAWQERMFSRDIASLSRGGDV